MNKITITYIIIFVLLFSIYNLFCQNDNTSDSDNSNIANVNNEKEGHKKKFPGIFSFYYKEKLSFENDVDEIYIGELKSEINLGLSIPINLYTIKIWADDLFITDFIPIIYNYRSLYIYDLFFNSFTAGLDNKFKIKRIMNIITNFEFGINTPFYDSMSLYFNPILNLNGNYYFGFNWEIEQSFPIETYLNINIISFTSSTYLKLAFEVFRFYGPRNFRFTIIAEDTLDYLILDNENGINTLENQFKAGIIFKIYNFFPSIYFIYNVNSSLPEFTIINKIIGFKAGLYFSKNIFNFNMDYTGSVDLNSNILLWTHRFDLYFKISINN